MGNGRRENENAGSDNLVTIILLISIIFILILTDNRVYQYMYDIGTNRHLDKWDWVAMIVGVVSLAVSVLVFRSQTKTEMNTAKVSKDTQVGLLIDYIRHFYANLVVVNAIKIKMGDEFDTQYPSQEHILKLAIDYEALHPEAFFRHKDEYNTIHDLLLLVRNFNIEVDVANLHLSSQDVATVAKRRDLNTLMIKPSILCDRFYDAIYEIDGMPKPGKIGSWIFRHCVKPAPWKVRYWLIRNCIRPVRKRIHAKSISSMEANRALIRDTLIKEMLKRDKSIPVDLRKLAKKKTVTPNDLHRFEEALKDIHVYYRENDNFAKLIFKKETSLYHYLLNHNISIELGFNASGTPKIAILPFPE